MTHFKGAPPINAVSYHDFGSEFDARLQPDELQPGIYLARLAINPYDLDIFSPKDYALDYRVQIPLVTEPGDIIFKGSHNLPIIGKLPQILGVVQPAKVVIKPLSPKSGQPLRGQTIRRPLDSEGAIELVTHGATPEVTRQGYFLPLPEGLSL